MTEQREATLITALEDALEIADILLEVLRDGNGMTLVAYHDTQDTLGHLRRYLELLQDKEETKS